MPTRPRVAYPWLLDTLNIRGFWDGSGPRMRDLLARNPAAVFIPNYRTDWLPAEDHDFIARRYVSLSDDLWVLGSILPRGGGGFEVARSGRYRISIPADSGLAGAPPEDCAPDPDLRLDGERLKPGAVALTAGFHRLRADSACQPAMVWVGPRLERPPRPAWREHRRLFIDWY